MMNTPNIAPLFEGWEEALIWSCLQGCMGYAVADNDQKPTSALITVGDFCFLAGVPNRDLAAKATAPIIVPHNEDWGRVIESVWGNRVDRELRYAIKKEPNVFDRDKLTKYVNAVPDTYALKLFDEKIYKQSLQGQWSKDFCSQFSD